jgi:hypothetical protein
MELLKVGYPRIAVGENGGNLEPRVKEHFAVGSCFQRTGVENS